MGTKYNPDESTPLDRLLVALVGKEKSGKSRLAATARKPILFLDWDGRFASVAGRPGVYGETFLDTPNPMKQPSAFTEALALIDNLEKTGGDLSGCGFKCPPGTHVKTIVSDSIQYMAKAAQRYILFTGSVATARTSGLARKVDFGGMEVRFPNGFDYWNAEINTITDTLLRLFGLGCDVIATFHETAEETPESTFEKPSFTGKVGIFPVRYQRLLALFNEVWRIERGSPQGTGAQDAVPRVMLTPDYNFNYGCSALDVDAVEVPDIEKIIAKHVSRRGSVGASAPTPPTPVAPPAPMVPPAGGLRGVLAAAAAQAAAGSSDKK